MKIKNNTKNLIPRKQIGGQIPKFQKGQNIQWIGTNGLTYNSKDNPGEYRVVDGRVQKKRFYGWTDKGPVATKPTNTQSKVSDSNKHRNGRGFATDKYDKAPTGVISATTPQGKPAGTKGSGTKGDTRSSGTRGNARTIAKPTARTTTIPAVKSTINVPNGMEYASDYLNASTPGSVSSTYNTLAQNVLSDVDKRIAEIRPTISSRSTYADMEDAMAGWDLKRKQKMMDASIGTAWDWNTEEGRKNFVGMANLMKNGKGNYNKIYNQWIASQPKTTESQNETYAQRFPLAYQSGLLTTPITDNLSLTTQQPTSTNQPSVGWVNTQAIQDAVNRVMPQLSVGNTNNNNFTTLELPQNFSGFATDLFKRKRSGNWTFAKQGTKLIRRK